MITGLFLNVPCHSTVLYRQNTVGRGHVEIGRVKMQIREDL